MMVSIEKSNDITNTVEIKKVTKSGAYIRIPKSICDLMDIKENSIIEYNIKVVRRIY